MCDASPSPRRRVGRRRVRCSLARVSCARSCRSARRRHASAATGRRAASTCTKSDSGGTAKVDIVAPSRRIPTGACASRTAASTRGPAATNLGRSRESSEEPPASAAALDLPVSAESELRMGGAKSGDTTSMRVESAVTRAASPGTMRAGSGQATVGNLGSCRAHERRCSHSRSIEPVDEPRSLTEKL